MAIRDKSPSKATVYRWFNGFKHARSSNFGRQRKKCSFKREVKKTNKRNVYLFLLLFKEKRSRVKSPGAAAPEVALIGASPHRYAGEKIYLFIN
ncbi:hypothetical protein EVAR_19413_1 [Eumeta japonica]|uniref:Uncharacterized protein n=1 Tax=Eumeta variegata TaxID=151549 RepID=A0A4C1TRJ7_EUMVA|nr:hypothetical protein EVAR_19413_1 [Eumeta japonica]